MGSATFGKFSLDLLQVPNFRINVSLWITAGGKAGLSVEDTHERGISEFWIKTLARNQQDKYNKETLKCWTFKILHIENKVELPLPPWSVFIAGTTTINVVYFSLIYIRLPTFWFIKEWRDTFDPFIVIFHVVEGLQNEFFSPLSCYSSYKQ